MEALGWQAWLTAGVVAAALVALAFELAHPAHVMLGALVALLVAGVVEPEAALSGFSSPATLAVAALYVVAAAVRKTHALAVLERVMRPRSPAVRPALTRLMLPVSLLSAFLNNTPIVSILTPLVQQWARRVGMPASKLLIPLSYATILGGICTLIGTSTNLVVANLMTRAGQEPLGMFELAWVGVPAVLVGFVYFITLGHRLLPATEDQAPLPDRTRRDYQFDVLVPEGSPLAGQAIEHAGLRHLEDAFLAHIRRQGEIIGSVAPSQRLRAGDVLTFIGAAARLDGLLAGGSLARVIEPPADNGERPAILFYEAVVSAESSLVGRTLKDARFRERFQAVVLGIHRRGRRLGGPVGLTPIEPGDLLLVEAAPNFEELWLPTGEFYLVARLQREANGHVSGAHALATLAVLVAMMVVVTVGVMPMVTAAFAGAVVVVAAKCVTPGEARRAVDFSVLAVIAASFGIGEALHATGLAGAIAQVLLGLTPGLGATAVLAVIYLTTNLLTELLTNSVAAVLAFPIGLALAADVGLDPRAVAVAIAVAASAGFATPIGYQTNLMIMGPGGYRFRDFVRVGLPLNLLILGVTLLVVPRVWPS